MIFRRVTDVLVYRDREKNLNTTVWSDKLITNKRHANKIYFCPPPPSVFPNLYAIPTADVIARLSATTLTDTPVVAYHERQNFLSLQMWVWGYAVAQLVEALRYKPEVRRFDSRWSHWNFSVT